MSPFTLIDSYTRAQAITDGALVDVTETSKSMRASFLGDLPVALTLAAHEKCVKLSPAAERAGNTEVDRLWDVLYMAHHGAVRLGGIPQTGGECLFKVYCVTTLRRPNRVTLKVVLGPGDDGEPVWTIMLPEED